MRGCTILSLTLLGACAGAADTAGHTSRASLAAWWGMPDGTPERVATATRLEDVDGAVGVLAQAAISVPAPYVPTIGIGGWTWSSDTGGTEVSASDVWVSATWEWSALKTVAVFGGVAAHLTGLELDSRFASPPALPASYDHSDVIPALVVGAWLRPIAILDAGVELHLGAIGDRRLTAAQAQLGWAVLPTPAISLGLTAGYRHQTIVSGGDGEAELTLHGPFLGLALTF